MPWGRHAGDEGRGEGRGRGRGEWQVTQLVGELLEVVRREAVVVQQDVVVSRPAGALGQAWRG